MGQAYQRWRASRRARSGSSAQPALDARCRHLHRMTVATPPGLGIIAPTPTCDPYMPHKSCFRTALALAATALLAMPALAQTFKDPAL